MEFQAELLNYRELISRLPTDVRASEKYWIKRIKHKAGTELLNNLDRAMREEEEEGDGSISVMSVSRDWTDFAYMMWQRRSISRGSMTWRRHSTLISHRRSQRTSVMGKRRYRGQETVRNAMAASARTVCHRRTSATSTAR